MRIKNTDKNFEKCIISHNNIVIHKGDILEASEEEGKIWVLDYNHELGYQVLRGNVKIHLVNVLDATRLIRKF